MNINASIIDQRLGSVTEVIRRQAAEELRISEASRLKSLAFVYFCVKTVLDLEDDDAFDCLTEGGRDFGVDAMHISEEYDGEFTVSLFQAKYRNNLVQKITYATNSQNPVDLKDLRANDDRQQRLELDIQQLGFNYRRKRSDGSTRSTDITSGVAAEAVLSVWQEKPQQAKFFAREHFGKLYDSIFTDQLNGAQVVLAVQLYRIAENRRKRPEGNDPDFVRYASCFIAMQMGRRLLNDMSLRTRELDHRNFQDAHQRVEQNGEAYFNSSVQDIQQALHELYGEQEISLQQLSATFRRGDLIGNLQQIEIC